MGMLRAPPDAPLSLFVLFSNVLVLAEQFADGETQYWKFRAYVNCIPTVL